MHLAAVRATVLSILTCTGVVIAAQALAAALARGAMPGITVTDPLAVGHAWGRPSAKVRGG